MSLFGGTTFGQTGGLFGSNSAFTSNTSFAFNPPAYDASKSQGFNLFGTNQQNTFGVTNQQNTFGVQNTVTFGQNNNNGQNLFAFGNDSAKGTGNPRFDLTPHHDSQTPNVTQYLHAISAMQPYARKCFEELRFEDYALGRRGVYNNFFGTNSNAGTTNLFGNNNTNNTSNLFGAGSNNLFGGNNNNNTTTPNLFGTGSRFGGGGQQQSTGLFGSTPSQTEFNLFGPSSSSASSGGSLFGGSGFSSGSGSSSAFDFNLGLGSNNNNNNTGLNFNWGSAGSSGSSGSSGSLFDFSSSSSFGSGSSGGSLFGSLGRDSGSSSLFGGSSLFGMGTASSGSGSGGSLFGNGFSSSSSSGGLFGNGSLGGSTGSSSWNCNFGTGSSGSSSSGSNGSPLFGGSLWGNNGGSSTGSSWNWNLGTDSSGSSSTGSGSLFGNSFFGSSGTTSLSGAGQSLVATIDHNPYGVLPSLSTTIKAEEESISSLKSPIKKAVKATPHYKLTPRSTAKIRPRGYQARTMRRLSLDDIGTMDDRLASPEAAVGSPLASRRKLIIDERTGEDHEVSEVGLSSVVSPSASPSRSQSFHSAPSSPAHKGAGSSSISINSNSKNLLVPGSVHHHGAKTSAPIAIPSVKITSPSGDTLRDNNFYENDNDDDLDRVSSSPSFPSPLPFRSKSLSPPRSSPMILPSSPPVRSKKPIVERPTPGTIINRYGGGGGGSPGSSPVRTYGEFYSAINSHNLAPKLKASDYEISPSLAELKKMSADELAHVENFTVRRRGYGSVTFLEPVDLRGVRIDKVVDFAPCEILVYPDEGSKPNKGQGLNVGARVTLEQVWPREKRTKKHLMDQKEIDRLIRRLKRTEKTKFLSYDPATGEWTFEVPDFD
jgi:nuclear pore complex protein Nup98-Nup96